MKSLSLILNVILLIAVAVLFYFHFSSTNPVSSSKDVEQNTRESGNIDIAYVNADTVLINYDFFKEKQKELENLQQKLDKEYRNRAQGLQNEVNNYQQTISTLTIGQAKAIEEDLMKKQQNLRIYQEKLTQDLMQKEAEINKELYDKVTSFIEDYSKKHDIELVVKYNQGSDVLYAGEAMDITRDIIEGLNNFYSEKDTVSTATE